MAPRANQAAPWPVGALAVTVDDQRLDVADLILLGLLRGTWQEFVADVRVGVTLERDRADGVSDDDVRAAATDFRYRHRLVSAADFTLWLGARGLSAGDLSGVLRRALLRERLDASDAPPVAREEVARVLWGEAVCHGALRDLAQAGVACLVAAQVAAPATGGSAEAIRSVLDWVAACDGAGLAELGKESLRVRLERLHRCESAPARLEESLPQDALDRSIGEHGLDWVRLDGQELSLDDEDAAREARLLLTEDRIDVIEVAKRAGVTACPRSVYIGQAAQEVTAGFVAAAPGDVLGPWRERDRWLLLQVTARRRPSLEDPILRARAGEEVLDDLIRRRAAGRVHFHISL